MNGRRDDAAGGSSNPRPGSGRGFFAVCVALALLAHPAPAQEHAPEGRGWGVGAQVLPLLTHAAPALYGESYTEGYLSQPMLMGHGALGRVRLQGALNFEGLTLERGELNAGIWGEGYIDRRHPHTYLHELMATIPFAPAEGVGASLSLGKGFVPFGTDDPMVRPFAKYPANHHLAQILERAVAIAAVRVGPAVAEAALFNGDEPTGPADLPNPERFGDSWAARLTLLPTPGVELQASRAAVRSPEEPGGGGLDQRKWSASARLAGARHGGAAPYVLLEWARTTDHEGDRSGNSYTTLLGEGSVPWRGFRLAARYERTERPEEERLLDPFRTPRPHPGAHVLGVTRWDILTLGASRAVEMGGGVRALPFVEGAYLRAEEAVRPSFFVPEEFYGSDRMWSLSLGVRVEAGAVHPRMGRYGVALPPAPPPKHVH